MHARHLPVRPVARILLVAVLAALPVGLAAVSCGTDAQNVDACRQIEGARCEVAPACSAGFDVDRCKRFYGDECLVGIGNPDAGDVTNLIQPCIKALQTCAAADASAEAGCPGLALDEDAECRDTQGKVLEPTPCNILMHCPEVLQACKWAAKPPSNGTGGGDGGTGDGGTSDGGNTGGGDGG
jgi:hypothetical protein